MVKASPTTPPTATRGVLRKVPGLGDSPIVPLVNEIGQMRRVEPLGSARLQLEPLRPEHADELAPLLDDPRLYQFTGGGPVSLAQLRLRFERLASGFSTDGSERWLNWLVRRRDTGQPVGTVQATVSDHNGEITAALAWVIVVPHQGQGYAREAARLIEVWLQQQGVAAMVAHIHPHHQASMAVARALGLAPTDTVVEGEVRWSNGERGSPRGG